MKAKVFVGSRLWCLWLTAACVFALACTSHAQTFNSLHSFSGPDDGTDPLAGLIQASDGNFYGTTSQGGPYNHGTVFRFTSGGTLTTLHGFSGSDGADPEAALIQASDGNLYGTTEAGGEYDKGTVFRIMTSGTLTTLYSFTGRKDGGYPVASLSQASDGDLYGTTPGLYNGIGNGFGTVFRVTTSGTLTTLYSFSALRSDGSNSHGANPLAGLIQASDGNLYGTTANGGAISSGTIFRITTGGILTTLYSFTGGPDGAGPGAGLIQASDGNLYGTTGGGGANIYYGTVFRITTSDMLTTLYSFTGGTDGAYPDNLIQAGDGNLYGTTNAGGADGNGTVFRITTSGTLTTLYSFTGGTDGVERANLIQATDGNLYGATPAYSEYIGYREYFYGTVFRITTGGTLTTLYSFTGGTDGADPIAGLMQARDGNLYGTTLYGGANGNGTVFRITTGGTLTTLYSFTGGKDGAYPGNLMQARDGNLYGTTEYGGTTGGGPNGSGTIFKITTSGTLTTLYSFSGPDGSNPQAGLMQARDGNLYGTTYSGGANDWGTVFKITTGGTLTTLHSFSYTDGAYGGALIQASDGNLYGTTYSGAYGWGTVFRITTSGTLTTLYSFTGGTDGVNPGNLMQASDGNLYGTTEEGGAYPGPDGGGNGTVFQITTSGKLTTLHSFTGGKDGANPVAGLIQASDGNLYGTTEYGGAKHSGTVFQITTGGTLTTLHDFSSIHWGIDMDGANPVAGLIQAKDGTLYGSTFGGGDYGLGTLFSIVYQPVLNAIDPGTRRAASAGVTLSLYGDSFTPDATVYFGNTALATTFVRSDFLAAALPSNLLYTPGKYPITVVQQGGTSNAIDFTVTPGNLLTVNVGQLTRDADNNIDVPVTIINTTTIAVDGVEIKASTLNAVKTTTPLPISLGDLGIGGSGSATLVFPGNTGQSGQAVPLTVKVGYKGGSLGFTVTVTLP